MRSITPLRLHTVTLNIARHGRAGSLPEGFHTLAVDEIVEVLNEIEEAHIQDKERNRAVRMDSSEYFAYSRRVLWRLGSYVVLATNLQRVIQKVYERYCGQAQRHLGRPILDQASFDERNAELRDLRKWRNKVFAHAAFAKPEDESETYLFNTLQLLAGNGMSHKDGEIQLAASWVIGDEDLPRELRPISFEACVPAVVAHVSAWRPMFEAPFQELRQLTIAQWQSVDPTIAHVQTFDHATVAGQPVPGWRTAGAEP